MALPPGLFARPHDWRPLPAPGGETELETTRQPQLAPRGPRAPPPRSRTCMPGCDLARPGAEDKGRPTGQGTRGVAGACEVRRCDLSNSSNLYNCRLFACALVRRYQMVRTSGRGDFFFIFRRYQMVFVSGYTKCYYIRPKTLYI